MAANPAHEQTPSEVRAACEKFREDFERLRAEVGKVIVGHNEVVEGVLSALFAGGNVLLEGVPGLGKTLLVRTLAQTLDLPFNRVQFTPDLMPADVIGTNIVTEHPDTGRRQFEFQRGPIFAQIVLADEINRATPKTQSALLEAMQEKTVTVANRSFVLEPPFFVLATQNPLEMEGTYPLPEAQLDRFMFKVNVAYPSVSDLISIIDRTTGADSAAPRKAADGHQVLAMGSLALATPVASHITDYVARLVVATHPGEPSAPDSVRRYVRYGASPRGAQALIIGAKVNALLEGRFNVAFEDVQAVAAAALRHRLLFNFEGLAEGISPDAVVTDLLAAVRKTGA